jgi:hypothetical protein
MKDKVFWLRAYGFFLVIVLIAASAWVVTHPLAQLGEDVPEGRLTR